MRISLLLLLSCFVFADTIPTAILHPARMMFYTFYPTDPSITNTLLLTFSETNDYEKEPCYYIDYELSALTIRGGYKLSKKTQIFATIPLLHVWGGFLDTPLDAFHNATGTLHGYRHNQDGKDRVHFRYLKAYKTSSFSTLGNIQIELKHSLPTTLPQAVIFGIKLPTARSDSGFGSGKIDYMIGYSAKYKRWDFGIDLAYLGRFTTRDIRSKRVLYGAYLGYGYRGWTFQYRFLSSPFSNLNPQFDSVSNTIDIAYQKGKWRFFISENLAPFYNTPDFTIGVNYQF